MDNWINVPTNIDQYVGFVYLIKCPDGRFYVGKKMFWAHPKDKRKGARKGSRRWVETNWRSYYGSSEETISMRKTSKEGWVRQILHLCKSKWEMSYLEAKEIFDRDALIRDSYINAGIRTLRLSPTAMPSYYV